MRLLLWGLAAVALFATEPGKRLQKKAICTFQDLKGKACGKGAESGEDLENKDESGSIERRPDVGSEENEEQAEPRIFEESAEDESSDDESDDSDKSITGLDPKKAEQLVEKLNVKPSAPEGELKSA